MSLLLDLQPGQEFEDLICALAARRRKTAKSGKTFIALRLRDCSGERIARWFSPPDGCWEELENAQLVRAAGTVEDGAWRGERKIYSAKAIAPEDAGDLNQFLPARPANFEAHRDRFIELVRSVQDPHFKTLLETVFHPKSELWAHFCDAPAARKMHHAYRGGSLEHSAEVAALCDRAAWTLDGLDRDLLVTAALLHDIGKLEEMESGLGAGDIYARGRVGRPYRVGNLFGHGKYRQNRRVSFGAQARIDALDFGASRPAESGRCPLANVRRGFGVIAVRFDERTSSAMPRNGSNSQWRTFSRNSGLGR